MIVGSALLFLIGTDVAWLATAVLARPSHDRASPRIWRRDQPSSSHHQIHVQLPQPAGTSSPTMKRALLVRGGLVSAQRGHSSDESETSSREDTDTGDDESEISDEGEGEKDGRSDIIDDERSEVDDSESKANDEITNEAGSGSDVSAIVSRSSSDEDHDVEEATPRAALTETPATSSSASHRSTRIKTSKSNQRKDKAPLPPNALYRFWLSKGRFGHVVVTLLVLTSECCTRYVPHLASWTSWTLKKCHIYDAEKVARAAEARRRAAMRGHAVGMSKKRRFGGHRKVKTAKKKRADQVAVNKLKSIGEAARESKYCHLSLHFMKRHALGPYGIDYSILKNKDGLVKDWVVEIAAAKEEEIPTEKEATRKDASDVAEIETEEEEDWVVQGLTSQVTATDDGKTHIPEEDDGVEISDERRVRLEPLVEIETSRSGKSSVSIGVDFTIGGRKSRQLSSNRHAMLKAAVASKSLGPRRRIVGQRGSDRDGGGGVLGRLRAAGATNMISSRMLGAYPGDALPIEDAGSARGLYSLASRYGYGAWSDSDEDSDFCAPKIRTKKPKRKRKRRSSNSGTISTSGQRQRKSISEASPNETSQKKRSSRSRRSSRRTNSQR